MLHVFAALGYSALQQPAAPPPLLRPGESRVATSRNGVAGVRPEKKFFDDDS